MLLNKRGFTLIEITIAITVLGILAGIVTVGYQGYLKNVKQTQISTGAEASIGALRAYALENNSFPYGACLPKGGFCCMLTGSLASPMSCNQATVTADIDKYVSNEPTYLPNFNGMQPCTTSGIISDQAPCTTTGSAMASYTYLQASPLNTQGLFASNDSSVNGFLVYYVGPDYKCGMNNLFEIVASSVGGYGSDEPLYTLGPLGNDALHSAQSTDPDTGYIYNECIVGIRAK